MFSILAFAALFATAFATPKDSVTETKDLNSMKTAMACADNKVLVGFTCKDNCKYMNIRCRSMYQWGKFLTDSKMGVCDPRSGSHILVGFDNKLHPKCRILEKKDGKNKEFSKQCKWMTATFDSGVGINCPYGLISKVRVDRKAEKIHVACCRDDDFVRAQAAKSAKTAKSARR